MFCLVLLPVFDRAFFVCRIFFFLNWQFCDREIGLILRRTRKYWLNKLFWRAQLPGMHGYIHLTQESTKTLVDQTVRTSRQLQLYGKCIYVLKFAIVTCPSNLHFFHFKIRVASSNSSHLSLPVHTLHILRWMKLAIKLAKLSRVGFLMLSSQWHLRHLGIRNASTQELQLRIFWGAQPSFEAKCVRCSQCKIISEWKK